MVFGDNPPSDILATRTLSALLLASANGTSPMFGLIHFSRQPFHNSNVAGAIGLRLRRWMWSSRHFACSRNVTPWACFTTCRSAPRCSRHFPRRFHGRGVPFQIWTDDRAGDRAYLGSHMLSRFLPCHIHPPTNDPPFTTCFDVAVLTSSAGHALSSPLHRCRGNDINIAC
jgi:hypothetical protein